MGNPRSDFLHASLRQNLCCNLLHTPARCLLRTHSSRFSRWPWPAQGRRLSAQFRLLVVLNRVNNSTTPRLHCSCVQGAACSLQLPLRTQVWARSLLGLYRVRHRQVSAHSSRWRAFRAHAASSSFWQSWQRGHTATKLHGLDSVWTKGSVSV